MEKFLAVAIGMILVPIFIFFVGLIFALPVMWLWNWLCPVIFGLPVIGFWQAWGLFFLAGLLTKGSGTSS